MRRVVIAWVCGLTCATPALAAQWSSATRIPDTFGPEGPPLSLALRSDGVVVVATRADQTLRTRTAGGTWTTASEPRQEDDAAVNAAGAMVGIDNAPSTVATFRSPDGVVDLTPAPPGTQLRTCAINADGGAVAAGAGNGAVTVISRPAAGSWNPVTVATLATDASVGQIDSAIATDGTVVVAWSERIGSTWSLRVVRGAGATFAVPVTIGSGTAPIVDVRVGVDDVGTATIVWVDNPVPTIRTLHGARLDLASGAHSTSGLATIGTAGRPFDEIASLAVASDGHVVVAWSVGTWELRDIRAIRRAPGGEWQSVETVSQSVPLPDPLRTFSGPRIDLRPRVAIAPGGRAMVVWLRASGGPLMDMPQASFATAGSGWTPADDLTLPKVDDLTSSALGRVLGASPAIAADGRAVVSWSDDRGGGADPRDGSFIVETAPPAMQRAPRRFGITRVVAPARVALGTALTLTVNLNGAVENVPVAVERLSGTRWLPIHRSRIDGAQAILRFTAAGSGRQRYRVRLTGGGSPAARVVAVRITPRPAGTVSPCGEIVEAGGTGNAWAHCVDGDRHSLALVSLDRRIERRVALPNGVIDVDLNSSAIWAATRRTLARIPLAGRPIAQPAPLHPELDERILSISARDNAVWVLVQALRPNQTLAQAYAILEVDPATLNVRRRINVEQPFERFGGRLVTSKSERYLLLPGDITGSRLVRVDDSGRDEFTTPVTGLRAVDSGPLGVWGITEVIDSPTNLYRIAPSLRRFTAPVLTRGGLMDVAVGRNTVWVITGGTTFRVRRVNPITGIVRTIAVLPVTLNDMPELVGAGSRVWLLSKPAGTLQPLQ